MEDKPKEAPKEKVHKSGLPKPPATQLPHDTGVIKNDPEIVEFDQKPKVKEFELEYKNLDDDHAPELNSQ
jgi:hypothetical protein